ncbi:MAG: hypothetical protein JWM12_1095, partial [Ilumatobacteraceae bacterium]|nr:hypothetical protein [Ilumatobacteraceae bacterium]
MLRVGLMGCSCDSSRLASDELRLADLSASPVQTVHSTADALRALSSIDCLLLCFAPGGIEQALADVDDLMLADPGLAVVIVTEDCDASHGLEFLHRGASDHLTTSDVRDHRLARSITYAVARSQGGRTSLLGEHHFRSIVESLGDGVIVQNRQGLIMSLNHRAAEIFGIPHDATLGRSSTLSEWSPCDMHGRAIPLEERPGHRCVASGQPVRDQLLTVDAGGQSRAWVNMSSYPLRDHRGGAVSGVVTVLRDVTAQQAMAESVRFQAQLLDAVGQCVIATDTEGRVTYWNRAAERVHGWRADEVLGRHVSAAGTFESDPRTRDIVDLMVRGESWTGDLWARRRDGSRFPILITNTPVLDASGNMTGVIGVFTDISERVADEQKVRLLSSIVEASPDGIYTTDLNGTVTSWNEGAATLYGYRSHEAIGRHISIL